MLRAGIHDLLSNVFRTGTPENHTELQAKGYVSTTFLTFSEKRNLYEQFFSSHVLKRRQYAIGN